MNINLQIYSYIFTKSSLRVGDRGDLLPLRHSIQKLLLQGDDVYQQKWFWAFKISLNFCHQTTISTSGCFGGIACLKMVKETVGDTFNGFDMQIINILEGNLGISGGWILGENQMMQFMSGRLWNSMLFTNTMRMLPWRTQFFFLFWVMMGGWPLTTRVSAALGMTRSFYWQ